MQPAQIRILTVSPFLLCAGGLSYDPAYTGPVTYTIPTCVIVTANTRVQCSAPPGVGGNYSWTVIVAGGASAPSSQVRVPSSLLCLSERSDSEKSLIWHVCAHAL